MTLLDFFASISLSKSLLSKFSSPVASKHWLVTGISFCLYAATHIVYHPHFDEQSVLIEVEDSQHGKAFPACPPACCCN